MSFEAWSNINWADTTEKLRNEYLRLAVVEAQETGLTQTSTSKALRQLGFSFGNQRFSDLWHGMAEEKLGFYYMRNLPLDSDPDPLSMRGVSWLRDNYLFIGSYDMYDDNGNFIRRNTLGVYSDGIMTRREAMLSLVFELAGLYGVDNPQSRNLKFEGSLRLVPKVE